MKRHVAMAISQWKPAEDGDDWKTIDRAWLVLVALVDAALVLDRGEMS